MQKEIKYISFYDLPLQKYKRVSSLAAVSMVDYVSDVLLDLDIKVNIISPSWYDNSAIKASFIGGEKHKIKNNLNITFGPSFGTKNKYLGYIKILFSLFWLFFFLVKNVKKNEKILVYHSPWLGLPLLLAKKIKKFHLILDVEEIYSDVNTLHPFFDIIEKKIIKSANSYLFSTEILAEKLSNNKNFAVYYGNYKFSPTLASKINDEKIHLLYAGIIDFEKRGAFNAIESALFLNEKYQMHIIGSGEVEKLKQRIDEINKISSCKIVYDGQLSGEDYIKYCQSCHIGLSTQKMEAGFVNSSFPSKILSYLGMGLPVVSCNVPVVLKSKIAENVSFYNIDSPENIALAIKKINIENNNSTQVKLQNLHSNFLLVLNKIINS